MKFRDLLIACIVTAGTISIASAEDITLNSWNDLKNNSQNLNNNYTFNGSINPTETITIGGGATQGSWNLNGNNILLDGNYGDYKLTIENNINSFVFENLNVEEFKSNWNDANGGVIYNKGTNGVIKNSVFVRSGAKNGSNGGVIYNAGTLSLIDKVTAHNNFVDNANGGVIYNTQNAVIDKISNSEFYDNTANSGSSAGAGIYNQGEIKEIVDTTIRNNSSTGNAGAIYNSGIIGSITGGSISSNRSNSGGGAIYNTTGATIGTISTKFEYNTAGGDGKNGGAIHNMGTISKISGSEFNNNGNVSVGGAIYNLSNDVNNKAVIAEISDTQFKGNYANWGGSAICNDNTGAEITTILNSDFIENISNNEGGALRNKDGALIGTIQGGSFTGNEARGNSGFGGAIYNQSATINTISGVNFGTKDENGNCQGNIAYEGGGAIYNSSNSTIGIISNSNFYGNRNHYDGKNGGAINNNGIINTIENTVFEDNGGWVDGQEITSVGGAIFNASQIGSITGSSKFILSRAKYGGGAIFNKGTIDTVTAEFTNNFAENNGGGALKNTEGGNITTITGAKFENNTADGSDGKGGAIRNDSTIGTISNSEFYANKSNDFGGAIANVGGTITIIEKAIFGADGKANQGASGAAINNQDGATIGTITGSTFAYNKALETTDFDQGNGGAVRNFGGSTITNINGNTLFEGNVASGLKQEYVEGKNASHVYGGAIYNMSNSTIDTIENVTFKDNLVQAVMNHERVKGYAHGGAISNGGSYVLVEGGNRNEYQDNNSVINTIKNVTFEGNKAVGSGAYGGAIFNSKNSAGIGEIIGGTFKNNSVEADVIAMGGAIYTEKDMLLSADGSAESTKNLTFSGNTTKDNHNGETQNAIFVNNPSGGDSLTITLNSIKNGVITFDDQIDGGKDDGTGYIARNGEDYNLLLTGDDTSRIILNNSIINADAVLTNTNLTIGLTGDNVSDVFASQYTTLNAQSGNISLMDRKLANYNINKLIAGDTKWGIDIDWSSKTADTITITSENSAGLVKLNALNILNSDQYYSEQAKIQVIKGANGDENDANVKLSTENLDITKADVYRTEVNSNTIITDIDNAITVGTKETKDDSLVINGVIYDTLEYIATLETKNGEEKKFNFVSAKPVYDYTKDSLAVVEKLTVQGNSATDNLIDFKETTEFSVSEDASLTINNAGIVNTKNFTNNGTLKTDGALLANINTLVNNSSAEFNNTIFLSEEDTLANNDTMKFEASLINSKIENNGTVDFVSSSINNTLENNETANFKGNNEINGGVIGSSGVMNMVDGIQNINSKITDQSIYNIDAVTNISELDFINSLSNSITMTGGVLNLPRLGLNTLEINALNMQGGTVNIASVDVDLANAIMGNIKAHNSIAPAGGTITINNLNLLSDTDKTYTEINFADGAFASAVKNDVKYVDGKISRYAVSYNGSNGNFSFSKPSGYNGYNPSVFASAVATQVGGYMAELSTIDHSFYHIDTWGMLPQKHRFADANSNKYAISDTVGNYQNNSNSGIWVRPYTSFENVSLTHGPNVKTINYGTLIGGDSDFIDMGNGWKGVISAFAGYNGSSMDYANVTNYQNGGVLGATASLYKGKFFTGLTANAGASVGDAHTAFGTETYTMLMAGIASKTGYNIELADGKFTIQPSMLLGYSFVNTFDYTNASGVKIDSDPLHAIQISPKIRFISTLENGWQPYAQVGMMWNLMAKTNVTANEVTLPQLGLRPYVEYGVGLQRRWSDDGRFSAFGQAMIRNGSRNGVALSFGFKASLGKTQSVNTNKVKTVIKQNTNDNVKTTNTPFFKRIMSRLESSDKISSVK